MAKKDSNKEKITQDWFEDHESYDESEDNLEELSKESLEQTFLPSYSAIAKLL